MVYCRLLFSLAIIMLCTKAHAQEKSYFFNNRGIKNGLSNGRVIAMAEDQNGFIWFGTASGLNRFDGYDFKVFLHNEQDSTVSTIIISIK